METMTQENKELLLKDLCARLPYGVVIHFDEKTDQDDERLYGMRENGGKLLINDAFYIEEIKPYLFPLSSMTEEQYDEVFAYFRNAEMSEIEASGDYLKAAYVGENAKRDWLNAHHFDYSGLIEKGLAIDATGLNIY